MIITPEQAIKIVLARKTQDASLKLYQTQVQKWSFFTAVGGFGLGLLAGLVFRVWRTEWLGWVALGGLLVAMIAGAIYQAAHIIPDAMKLKNVEREISNPLLQDFNNDMDLMQQLTDFEPHHLSYARAMYANMARQLRERCGLLVGALDKVGLFPIAATTYFSYIKAVHDGISFGPIEWVAYGLIALFLFAVRMTSTAQWMESVAEIYGHAHAMLLARRDGDRKFNS